MTKKQKQRQTRCCLAFSSHFSFFSYVPSFIMDCYFCVSLADGANCTVDQLHLHSFFSVYDSRIGCTYKGCLLTVGGGMPSFPDIHFYPHGHHGEQPFLALFANAHACTTFQHELKRVLIQWEWCRPVH